MDLFEQTLWSLDVVRADDPTPLSMLNNVLATEPSRLIG